MMRVLHAALASSEAFWQHFPRDGSSGPQCLNHCPRWNCGNCSRVPRARFRLGPRRAQIARHAKHHLLVAVVLYESRLSAGDAGRPSSRRRVDWRIYAGLAGARPAAAAALGANSARVGAQRLAVPRRADRSQSAPADFGGLHSYGVEPGAVGLSARCEARKRGGQRAGQGLISQQTRPFWARLSTLVRRPAGTSCTPPGLVHPASAGMPARLALFLAGCRR